MILRGAVEGGVVEPRALSHVSELVAAGTRGRHPAEAPPPGNRRVLGVRSTSAARRASLAQEVASRAREAEGKVAQQNVMSCSAVRSRMSSARWQTRRGWMLPPVMHLPVACWDGDGQTTSGRGRTPGRGGDRGRGGRDLVGLRVAGHRSSGGNSSNLYLSNLYSSGRGVVCHAVAVGYGVPVREGQNRWGSELGEDLADDNFHSRRKHVLNPLPEKGGERADPFAQVGQEFVIISHAANQRTDLLEHLSPEQRASFLRVWAR